MQTTKPIISVIIPVYNSEPYLSEAIEGVLNQTFTDFELICVNDGSTDNSLKILRRYAKKHKNVTVIDKPNTGAGDSRNVGYQASCGEYLLWLDSDDIFEPELLEKLYDKIKATDADICIYTFDKFDEATNDFFSIRSLVQDLLPPDDPFAYTDVPHKIFTVTSPSAVNKLYKKSFVAKHNIQFMTTRTCNDVYFNYAALIAAKKITHVKDTLLHYRFSRTGSLSHSRGDHAACVVEAYGKVREFCEKLNVFNKVQNSFYERVLSSFNYEFLLCNREQKQALLKLIEQFFPQEQWRTFLRQIDGYNPAETVPRVSVIVPVYNVQNYLRQCLDSLLSQELDNIEIICVDDGSSDDSPAILREYAAQDDRIRVITQKNSGAAAARNAGMAIAKGLYIGFVDSDDWVDANYYKTLYFEAKRHNADLARAPYRYFYPDKEVDDSLNKLLAAKYENKEPLNVNDHTVIPCNAIYKRQYLVENNVNYDASVRNCEDVFFTARATYYAKKSIPVIGAYYHYRKEVHGQMSVFSPQRAQWLCKINKLTVDFINSVDYATQSDYMVAYYRCIWRYNDAFESLIAYEEQPIHKQVYTGLAAAYDNCKYPDLLHDNFYQRYYHFLPEGYEAYYSYVFNRMIFNAQPKAANVKVSVIIPVYNVEPYLKECLNSICNQSLTDIEIICVNDGSTDKSLTILEEYAKKDGRISIITQKNQSQAVARNTGYKQATGKYIYFFDSDDMADKEALSFLYAFAETKQAQLVLFDGFGFYENVQLEKQFPQYKTYYKRKKTYGGTYRGDELYALMINNGEYRVNPNIQFIENRYLKDNNITFRGGFSHEDDLFAVQALLHAQRVCHVNKKFYYRRMRANSTMTSQKTYSNFLGYYTCVITIMRLITKFDFCEAAVAAAKKQALSYYNGAKNCFLALLPDTHKEPRYEDPVDDLISSILFKIFTEIKNKEKPAPAVNIVKQASAPVVDANKPASFNVGQEMQFAALPVQNQRSASQKKNIWGLPFFKQKQRRNRKKYYFFGVKVWSAKISLDKIVNHKTNMLLDEIQNKTGYLKRCVTESTAAINAQLETRINELSQLVALKCDAQEQAYFNLCRTIEAQQNKNAESLQGLQTDLTRFKDQNFELLNKSMKDNDQNLINIRKNLENTRLTTYEILWAEIFKNTLNDDNPWLKDKSFSPGRWAAGYPFLYIIYRTLRETRPTRILELGLGETTRLLSQYTAANSKVEHCVVEHDSEWIDFFRQDFKQPSNTEIVQLPWGFVTFKDSKQPVRIYDGFAQRFAQGRYDFICIDGPLGGDMMEYARIDVLSLIPNHLAKSFVIIIDDYNRVGEQKTVNEIEQAFKRVNVKYRLGFYKGLETVCIICSEDLGFLCSL